MGDCVIPWGFIIIRLFVLIEPIHKLADTDKGKRSEISRCGIHWEVPELGHGEYKGRRNVVILEPTGMGNVFIDSNTPPEARLKYV